MGKCEGSFPCKEKTFKPSLLLLTPCFLGKNVSCEKVCVCLQKVMWAQQGLLKMPCFLKVGSILSYRFKASASKGEICWTTGRRLRSRWGWHVLAKIMTWSRCLLSMDFCSSSIFFSKILGWYSWEALFGLVSNLLCVCVSFQTDFMYTKPEFTTSKRPLNRECHILIVQFFGPAACFALMDQDWIIDLNACFHTYST